MFRAVFTEEPEPTVVITKGIWLLSADEKDLPEHILLEATVNFQLVGQTEVWELTCCVDDDECASFNWLIVHARHTKHVFGYFPLPNNNSNIIRPLPKPVQLVNSQPQQQWNKTDILLFAVQTTGDCDELRHWLFQTGGYAASEILDEQRNPDRHTMVVRTLLDAGRDNDNNNGTLMEHGNMLLLRTDTACFLSKTNILRLTLKVVQWEFTTNTSNARFSDNDVVCALEDQRMFFYSLPGPIRGNLEERLGAVLPVSSQCGWHAIYMAFLTLCCVAKGCTHLSCLSCVKNSSLIVESVHRNLHVFASKYSAREFLKNPRSPAFDHNLFFSLVSVALQMPARNTNEERFMPNTRRLLQLYLP